MHLFEDHRDDGTYNFFVLFQYSGFLVRKLKVLIEGEDSVGSIEWNSKFSVAIGSNHHVVQPS